MATARPPVFTIVTQAGAKRVDELTLALGAAVTPLVLDADDGAQLRDLLGERWEQYAAGFDEHELVLAVLPLLLLRALDEDADRVTYVSAGAEPTGTASVVTAAIAADPWPLTPGNDEGRLDAVSVARSPHTRRLLERWGEHGAGVLGEDNRTLTARTMLRWLRALGDVTHEVEIDAAGIAGAGTPLSTEEREGYGFAALPGGPELTPALRQLLQHPDTPEAFRIRPFSDPPGESLMRWLAEPAEPGGELPRYLTELCRRRGDLRVRWSDGSPASKRSLLAWAHGYGRHEDPILPPILGPLPSPAAGIPATADTGTPVPRPVSRSWGVNLVGYLQSEFGIGDAARLVVGALDAARVPLYPISPTSGPRARDRHPFVSDGPNGHPFGINLLCLNPDGILALHTDSGETLFAGRPTAGYMWWEVQDAFPPSWRPVFEVLDEVWVGSRFVQQAIEPASTVPVRLLPVPVVPLASDRARAEIRRRDRFVFLTVFDYDSAFERKNPLAVVRAFRRAFAPGSGAKLVVKSVNASHQPDNRDELAIAASDHPDIELRDGYVSWVEIEQLLAGADCIVSLHRAEGFGLPLARALRSGIPVVATEYGGNTDFMSAENSYLVSHTLTTVPEDNHYPSGATWAEPDEGSAAEQLRRVFEEPVEARHRAALGAAELARTHSLAATGARMAEALKRLGAASASQRPALRDALARVLPRRATKADARAEAIIEHLQRAGLDRDELEEAVRALRSGSGDAAVVARALAHARVS